MKHLRRSSSLIGILFLVSSLLASCFPAGQAQTTTEQPSSASPTPTVITPTPLATRPSYEPGSLVDYTAQAGDTLPVLAIHFNTTEKEIREANPILPEVVTTLPPGMPMKIPIYYVALWGNPFKIMPDSLFVNGPAQIGFNTVEFVNSQPGWLKDYTAFAGEQTRKGGEIIDYVAQNFSISPRVLLALAEYQAGALSSPTLPEEIQDYPLGYHDKDHRGFYMQLIYAANTLNNGYYGWRTGVLNTITRLDQSIEHPDPWQNAATVSLQYYFSLLFPVDQYEKAAYSEGFYKTYTALFGDPWANDTPHIPGSLTQPEFRLPFPAGKTWAFTGGPHSAWGDELPYAAIDFAPPSSIGGCAVSSEYATAVAAGEIVRTDTAIAMLDLDGDGDERTGWVILYLHLSEKDMIRQGVLVKAGDPIGHPSCEGGKATGSHVHIARKYNGEWISADSALPFNLEGWIVKNGSAAYLGTLTKFGKTVIANESSSTSSLITSNK